MDEEIDIGTECLDILVQTIQDRLSSLSTSPEQSQTDIETTTRQTEDTTDTTSTTTNHAVSTHHPIKPTKPTKPLNQPSTIKRTLLWSHHLLSTTKRKQIVTWSRELSLTGYSRPGYPGAILIEGEIHNVDEFVSRIKALRWQALQVRGEEICERRICSEVAGGGHAEQGGGVKEVEGLGDIVNELKKRDQDVADWFLEGMKIAHGHSGR